MDHPAFAVLDDAFEEVVGSRTVPVRSGGSIPIVPELGLTGAPVILTGIGLPDDGLHSPNEKLDLAQLWTGIRVFGRFFELFAERGHEITENDLGFDELPELKIVLANQSSYEYPVDEDGDPLYYDYVRLADQI